MILCTYAARAEYPIRATGNGQRATGNGQRATGNGQRATGNFPIILKLYIDSCQLSNRHNPTKNQYFSKKGKTGPQAVCWTAGLLINADGQ